MGDDYSQYYDYGNTAVDNFYDSGGYDSADGFAMYTSYFDENGDGFNADGTSNNQYLFDNGITGNVQDDGSIVYDNYVSGDKEYAPDGSLTGRSLADLVGAGNIDSGNSGFSGAVKTVGDLAKSAGSWINDNKTLAGLLGTGLLNALAGNKSAEAELAREQVNLRTRQRISDSITGMKPISVNRPGLLQTMSGKQVYDQYGRVVS